MKVKNTWVFTYDQFKDVKVLEDVICQVDEKKNREAWLTMNGYPNFHMITLYETSEGFYVKRPYYSNVRSGSGSTYHETLIKVKDKQIAELISKGLVK